MTEPGTATARRGWLDPEWHAQVASWIGATTDDQHDRLRAILPTLATWCAGLVSAGITASLKWARAPAA